MKNIVLNNKTYQVPTSWEEVTLEQQIKVTTDQENFEDERLKRMALLSGYCSIPIDELKRTQLKEVKKLFKYLSFLNDELPKEPLKEFEFNGNKYTVIDSLINQQFQDWVSVETAFSNHKENEVEALPTIFAVICKRENETLDDFDIYQRAEEFKKLPMTIVEPLRVFFSQIEKLSIMATQLSSKETQEKIVNERLKEFENTVNKQVGGELFMRLLRGILLRYLKYLKKVWMKYFNTTQ